MAATRASWASCSCEESDYDDRCELSEPKVAVVVRRIIIIAHAPLPTSIPLSPCTSTQTDSIIITKVLYTILNDVPSLRKFELAFGALETIYTPTLRNESSGWRPCLSLSLWIPNLPHSCGALETLHRVVLDELRDMALGS